MQLLGFLLIPQWQGESLPSVTRRICGQRLAGVEWGCYEKTANVIKTRSIHGGVGKFALRFQSFRGVFISGARRG